jgi:outer membrane protein assembly factor BamB
VTWAVCAVTDGSRTFSGTGTEEPVQATTTRVAVLDTDDGHLLADWPVEHDARIGVLPGLVLVGLRRDGDIEIVAHDARTGVERWRHQDSPAPNTSVPASSWSFDAAGDVAAYLDGDRLTVLSADGEVVRTDLQAPRGENLVTDPGTGLPTLPLRSQTGDLTGTTTLLARDADPTRDRVLRGRLLPLTVDDGSVPGLVLTSQDKLYAWDEESGRPRWDSDLGGAGFGALVVRGRVYLCGPTSVVALDGRTGDTVWETEAPACSYSGLLTDGQDLLVGSLAAGTTGLGGLTGYDFATGEVTRRFDFPAGLVQLGPFQEHLLGYSRTFEEVALLR